MIIKNTNLGMGCKPKTDSLQKLCDEIPGDALLFSMFKIDADPIKCPIKGMVINNKLYARKKIKES